MRRQDGTCCAVSRPLRLMSLSSWIEPTRALDLGFTPVVPPLKTRRHPWSFDRMLYRRRNEIERLFRRLKGFRRIFSRLDKLDVMFTAFIHFSLIAEALR